MLRSYILMILSLMPKTLWAEEPSSNPASQSLLPSVEEAATLEPKRLVPEDIKKVYLFFHPRPQKENSKDQSLSRVLNSLARARLNALESLRLKTLMEMPEVPKVIERFGDLRSLDRVSLIAIKNLTGFDGLIQVDYRYRKDEVELLMTCFDFRNGRIFRERHLKGPMNAGLFQTIEADLVEFATTVRRSYRVTLNIDSRPSKSQIYIDDRLIGESPLIHELKSGDYHIRIQKEGFKPYEQRFQLSDGDRLRLQASLYNPLAARFLNAPPGFRLDANELSLSYRYSYLDVEHPGLRSIDFMVLSWMLRFLSWNFGLHWARSLSQEAENRLDTFLGEGEGLQRYSVDIDEFSGVLKYALLEKYSFASLWLGGELGMSLLRSDDGDRELLEWSPSGALYLELGSRIFRGGNFSLEAEVDLGVSYLGQLPYTERKFSLYGAKEPQEEHRALLGPMGAISLKAVFWREIF